MKTSIAQWITRLAAVGMLAALVAVSAPDRAEAIQDSEKFGMVGLTRGQTARLNVVNVGNPDTLPCEVQLMFLDNLGRTLAGPEPHLVPPGQAVFLDLNADALGGPDIFGRFQIRAQVTLGGPDTKLREVRACSNNLRNLRSTLEVFDNDTGKSTVILNPAVLKGFNPQPDPPGKNPAAP
jgi:hypothetical protein